MVLCFFRRRVLNQLPVGFDLNRIDWKTYRLTQRECRFQSLSIPKIVLRDEIKRGSIASRFLRAGNQKLRRRRRRYRSVFFHAKEILLFLQLLLADLLADEFLG